MKNLSRIISFPAHLTLLFALLTPKALGVTPGEKWLTLQTPNFRVHTTQPHERFAQVFAAHLERFLPLLEQDLAWKLKTPVDIIVHDRADTANGFAASFPSNRMEVYPVAYENESSLMDYYDWVEELAVHELTHLVANDGAQGTWRTLRSIFGTAIRPNGIQPGWLVEGLAVFEESRLTKGGRGRSIFTEALLRSAVLEGKFGSADYLRLDRLHDGVFWWPGGNTRYLLGYALLARLEKDKAKISQLSPGAHAGQTIPGLLSIANTSDWPYRPNGVLQDLIGYDWNHAWMALKDTLEERYGKRSDISTRTCWLTEAGQFTGGIAISNDNWLYFSAHHPALGRVIARMPSDSPCIQPNTENRFAPEDQRIHFEVLEKNLAYGSAARVSVQKNGGYLVFADRGFVKGGKEFLDLFIFDLAKRKKRQITTNQRARDPAFTSNDQRIVYVKNLSDGRNRIESIDLDGKNVMEHFTSDYFERLSHPVEFRGRIYFSRHNNRGQDELLSVAEKGAQNKADRVIPDFGKGAIFSERTAFIDDDGTFYYSGNYASGDETLGDGARMEIYRWQAGMAQPEKIAAAPAGLSLWPIPLDQKNIIAATYGLRGFDLARLSSVKSEAKKKSPGDAKVIDLHQFLTVGEKTARGQSASLTSAHDEVALHASAQNRALRLPANENVNARAEAFTPYKTLSSPATSLWPQYWLPMYLHATGGNLFGAATSGQDPLEYHRYFALAMYDTRAAFPSYSVNYTNTSQQIGFALQANQTNNYFSGSRSSNRFNLYSAEAFTFAYGSRTSLGLGYQERRLGARVVNNFFPFYRVSFGGAQASNSLVIAPNRGLRIQQYIAHYPTSQGRKSFWDYRPSLELFLPGFSRSHSFSIGGTAAFSTNRDIVSNYFQGGGPISGIGINGEYIVRGYPEDTLFGQKILTLNSAYSSPLLRINSGAGLSPFFINTLGLRFRADAGSAIRMARYRGERFLGYQGLSLTEKFIYGVGAELLLDTKIGYYAPIEFELGLHRGLDTDFGGETRFYFGVNTGIFGI